jgi:hypothetical protein
MIALLSNTNVHSTALSGILFSLYLWDVIQSGQFKKPQGLSILIMIIGGALSIVQLWPPEDGQYSRFFADFNPQAIMAALSNAFLPTLYGTLPRLIGIFILCLATIAWITRPRVLILFYSFWICLLIILVFIWDGGVRHYGLFLMTFVFCSWIGNYENNFNWLPNKGRIIYEILRPYILKVLWITLSICLAVSCLVASRYWYLDVYTNFSGAREMAEFIKENELDNYTIAAHKAPFCEAVLAYLGKKQFWYAGEMRYGSYMLWDKGYLEGLKVSHVEAFRRIRQQFPDHSNLLILFCCPVYNPNESCLQLLYSTRGELKRENFYLYKPLPGFN